MKLTGTEILIIVVMAMTVSGLTLILNKLPSEADVANKQAADYCEMVRLHKADPELGWPDYKGIYYTECETETVWTISCFCGHDFTMPDNYKQKTITCPVCKTKTILTPMEF